MTLIPPDHGRAEDAARKNEDTETAASAKAGATRNREVLAGRALKLRCAGGGVRAHRHASSRMMERREADGGRGERRAVFGRDPADAIFIMYRPRHARSTRAVAQHLFVAHGQQLRARFELRLPGRVPLNTLADQSAGRQHDHRTLRMARRRFDSLPLRYASDVLPQDLPAAVVHKPVAPIATGEEGV